MYADQLNVFESKIYQNIDNPQNIKLLVEEPEEFMVSYNFSSIILNNIF